VNHGKILKEISDIRSRNNKNWMRLLELAFEIAPDRAKGIMADIVECDQAITKLCKEMIDDKG